MNNKPKPWLSQEEANAIILAEVQENRSRLVECPRHFWPSLVLEIGASCTCTKCGGYMLVVEAAEYLNGYRAAGGNPNDVLPGYYK